METDHAVDRDPERPGIRNPFGVMDVPNPDDEAVAHFASLCELEGPSDDENAYAWAIATPEKYPEGIAGRWSSRWNGGADPTIPGDARETWKRGHAEVAIAGERVYALFDWHDGTRRGLIDAQREGETRLVGKYVNLSNPAITRPWIGLIVSAWRIDGRWPGGCLDFRR
jgi:hypothetical protein